MYAELRKSIKNKQDDMIERINNQSIVYLSTPMLLSY
jgi:hypothetical protein